MRARRNPTDWAAGVRSAGLAAITSHHSLYWPPPIGILLNLKHMQLFLLGGNNSKAPVSLTHDKESVQLNNGAPVKRQVERLHGNIICGVLITFAGRCSLRMAAD